MYIGTVWLTLIEMETKSSRNIRSSDYEVFWLCMKYYFKEIAAAPQILLFVVASITVRGILYAVISDIVFELEGCTDLPGAVTRIFLYRIGILAIEGTSDILFESSMGSFQTRGSIRAVANILGNEVPGRLDMTSGRSQYFISKGVEGLSKIIKVVFIDVVGRFVYIQIDLYRIYSRYGHNYLVVGMVLLAVGLFIHVKGIFVVLSCRRRLNSARTQTDKKIYEILLNYDTIKAYQTEGEEAVSFKRNIDPWGSAFIQMKKVVAVLGMAHSLLFRISAYTIVLVLCKYNDADGNRVRNMYSLISSYDRSVEDISTIYGKLRTAILNGSMVLQYLGREGKGEEQGARIEYFHDRLEFRDVTFIATGAVVLERLSFVARKGDKIAIYGKNGVGKSTILKLILRLVEPTSGDIMVDDIPISNADMRDYRSLITYVPQQADLFDDSIYNNLRYGNKRSYGEIIEECKRFGIHDEIVRLRNGYNSQVGERGGYISGGLRQKIYCIRALLRDSSIYLLDEPTSNFDEESIDMLMNVIMDQRFSSRTFLVICHNMEIVKRFPRCLRLT